MNNNSSGRSCVDDEIDSDIDTEYSLDFETTFLSPPRRGRVDSDNDINIQNDNSSTEELSQFDRLSSRLRQRIDNLEKRYSDVKTFLEKTSSVDKVCRYHTDEDLNISPKSQQMTIEDELENPNTTTQSRPKKSLRYIKDLKTGEILKDEIFKKMGSSESGDVSEREDERMRRYRFTGCNKRKCKHRQINDKSRKKDISNGDKFTAPANKELPMNDDELEELISTDMNEYFRQLEIRYVHTIRYYEDKEPQRDSDHNDEDNSESYSKSCLYDDGLDDNFNVNYNRSDDNFADTSDDDLNCSEIEENGSVYSYQDNSSDSENPMANSDEESFSDDLGSKEKSYRSDQCRDYELSYDESDGANDNDGNNDSYSSDINYFLNYDEFPDDTRSDPTTEGILLFKEIKNVILQQFSAISLSVAFIDLVEPIFKEKEYRKKCRAALEFRNTFQLWIEDVEEKVNRNTINDNSLIDDDTLAFMQKFYEDVNEVARKHLNYCDDFRYSEAIDSKYESEDMYENDTEEQTRKTDILQYEDVVQNKYQELAENYERQLKPLLEETEIESKFKALRELNLWFEEEERKTILRLSSSGFKHNERNFNIIVEELENHRKLYKFYYAIASNHMKDVVKRQREMNLNEEVNKKRRLEPKKILTDNYSSFRDIFVDSFREESSFRNYALSDVYSNETKKKSQTNSDHISNYPSDVQNDIRPTDNDNLNDEPDLHLNNNLSDNSLEETYQSSNRNNENVTEGFFDEDRCSSDTQRVLNLEKETHESITLEIDDVVFDQYPKPVEENEHRLKPTLSPNRIQSKFGALEILIGQRQLANNVQESNENVQVVSRNGFEMNPKHIRIEYEKGSKNTKLGKPLQGYTGFSIINSTYKERHSITKTKYDYRFSRKTKFEHRSIGKTSLKSSFDNQLLITTENVEQVNSIIKAEHITTTDNYRAIKSEPQSKGRAMERRFKRRRKKQVRITLIILSENDRNEWLKTIKDRHIRFHLFKSSNIG